MIMYKSETAAPTTVNERKTPILLYTGCQSCDGDALFDTDDEDDDDDNGGGIDVSMFCCCCNWARMISFSRCMECM